MSVSLSPIFNGWQSFLANGLPNAGGFIYVYQAGTSTPATTYTSSTGGTPNSNPIALNSGGFPPNEIWLDNSLSYKFMVYDANNNQVGTYDNITPGGGLYPTLSDLANTSNYAKGAALVGRAVQVFPNVAAMLTVIGTAGQRAELSCYNNLGDNGGGALFWNASYSGSGDTGVHFVPTGASSGCWERDLSGININPCMFGADPTGVADSLAAFNAAIAYQPVITLLPGKYSLSNTLTLSAGHNYIGINGAGPGGTAAVQCTILFNHSNPGFAVAGFVILKNVYAVYSGSNRGEGLKAVGRINPGSVFENLYIQQTTVGISSTNFLAGQVTGVSLSWTGGTATATFTQPHGLRVGSAITITSAGLSGYNGYGQTITSSTSTSVSWALASNPGGSSTGTVAATFGSQFAYSAAFKSIYIYDFSYAAIFINDTGATGNHFDNVYINNSNTSNVASYGVYVQGAMSELEFTQLNIEHSIFGNGSGSGYVPFTNNGCNNLKINGFHIEGNTFNDNGEVAFAQYYGSGGATTIIDGMTFINNAIGATVNSDMALFRLEAGNLFVTGLYCNNTTDSGTGNRYRVYAGTTTYGRSYDIAGVISSDIFVNDSLPVIGTNNQWNKSYVEYNNLAPAIIGSATPGAAVYTGTPELRGETNGRQFSFRLNATWTSTTGTGNLRVSMASLPFNFAGTANTKFCCAVYPSGFPMTGTQYVAQATAGNDYFDIYGVDNTGTLTAVPLPASGSITMSGEVEV